MKWLTLYRRDSKVFAEQLEIKALQLSHTLRDDDDDFQPGEEAALERLHERFTQAARLLKEIP